MELPLKATDKDVPFYEAKFNDFRAFTMAIAEEEEVLKFYFYSRYSAQNLKETILIEAVIDRAERTLGLLCKYSRKDLFDFWYANFMEYLKGEGMVV